MEHKSTQHLIVYRVIGVFVGIVCQTTIAILLLLSIYTVYDGLIVNRETEGIEELRELVGKKPEAISWLDGMVAWLRIDGTHIDYPVMQGSDNKWFLTHDYLGRVTVPGSVFLDYRNSSDFGDGLSIIYGHRMNSGLMFSDVAKYSDADYFEAHRTGWLFMRDKKYYRLTAESYRVLSAEDKVYRELDNRGLGLGGAGTYIILSTCDRSEKMRRDVLILVAEFLDG